MPEDEEKSPVISEADSHCTTRTTNCSSPLLRGRNYCTHSSTTPDKPTDSGSKHCHSAPAVHIFITMCLNWLMVALCSCLSAAAQTQHSFTSPGIYQIYSACCCLRALCRQVPGPQLVYDSDTRQQVK